MSTKQMLSPKSKGKRRSLLEAFPDLQIGASSSSPSGKENAPGARGSFGRGWPPISNSMREKLSSSQNGNLPFTLRMSPNYRIYDDRWRADRTVKDESADMSSEFNVSRDLMAEIAHVIESRPSGRQDMENLITSEMAEVVYGSNQFERLGVDLDETIRLCLLIFEGKEGLESVDRTPEYQKKLDAFLIKTAKPGEKAVVRSRREVLQHAAAFQYMVNAFVKQDMNMSEQLIKDTHAILVKGLSAEDAGVVSGTNFAGTYRQKPAFAGAVEMAKPSEIPAAMRSMVARMQEDLAEIESSGRIDPFMLAAKYCDRFVNIHPFKDANGRVVIVLGEKSQDRDDYLQIAQESSKVGGHAGQLGTLVLTKADGVFRKMLKTLKRK